MGPVSRLVLPSLLSTEPQAITATLSQSEHWLDFYFSVPWHCCPRPGELGLQWRPWPSEKRQTRESTTNIVSYYAVLTSGDIWQRLCDQISRLYEHLRTTNVWDCHSSAAHWGLWDWLMGGEMCCSVFRQEYLEWLTSSSFISKPCTLSCWERSNVLFVRVPQCSQPNGALLNIFQLNCDKKDTGACCLPKATCLLLHECVI